MTDARFRGVLVHLNADESQYLARVQEALHGSLRLGSAIGGGGLPEIQQGLLEVLYGLLARPFTQSSAITLTVLDFFEPAMLFVILLFLFWSMGFSRTQSFLGTWFFCFLELYNLNRPVHQRGSFLLSLLVLFLLIRGTRCSVFWGVFGGMFMGVLVGVYFWAWTAVWLWWGLFVILEGVRVFRGGSSPSCLRRLFLFGGVGLLMALPFLWQMHSASLHPSYLEHFSVAESHLRESQRLLCGHSSFL